MFEIVQPDSDRQMAQVRELFIEYAESLGFDLDFQGVDKDFTDLPGGYAPPDGCLILAYQGTQPAGCVAVGRFEEKICEMKRLYVRPEFRGRGLGRRLALAVIDKAGEIGYERMRLDTIDWMKEAIALYRSLGFEEIAPYRHNPIEGAKFFELTM